MADLICVAFPTIMDGLVLRWYRDHTAYENGSETLSASRNGVMVRCYLHDVPTDVLGAATAAYDLLAAGNRELPAEMATHRTESFLRRQLVPIVGEAGDG